MERRLRQGKLQGFGFPYLTHMDERFEEYLLSNEYDRFEGYLLNIVRDAYSAGFIAGLSAKDASPQLLSLEKKPDAG